MRKKDFVVDDGVYKQDKITFFRTERTSRRRTVDKGESHLFTCNMANQYFFSNGAQSIIPTCHQCSTFSFDAKLKPLLSRKNQLQDKIAKRYQCQWLLRKSVPSHSTVAHSTVVEEGTLVSESSCHNSGQ